MGLRAQSACFTCGSGGRTGATKAQCGFSCPSSARVRAQGSKKPAEAIAKQRPAMTTVRKLFSNVRWLTLSGKKEQPSAIRRDLSDEIILAIELDRAYRRIGNDLPSRRSRARSKRKKRSDRIRLFRLLRARLSLISLRIIVERPVIPDRRSGDQRRGSVGRAGVGPP